MNMRQLMDSAAAFLAHGGSLAERVCDGPILAAKPGH